MTNFKNSIYHYLDNLPKEYASTILPYLEEYHHDKAGSGCSATMA